MRGRYEPGLLRNFGYRLLRRRQQMLHMTELLLPDKLGRTCNANTLKGTAQRRVPDTQLPVKRGQANDAVRQILTNLPNAIADHDICTHMQIVRIRDQHIRQQCHRPHHILFTLRLETTTNLAEQFNLSACLPMNAILVTSSASLYLLYLSYKDFRI